MITLITSGDQGAEANGAEWVDVLEVPGTSVVNWISIINEGDFPGWWRLVDNGSETLPARLPCGSGVPGERRAGINLPCPGFSGGQLQIKKALGGGNLSGVFAFAGR